MPTSAATELSVRPQTVTPTPEGLFVRERPMSPLDLSTRILNVGDAIVSVSVSSGVVASMALMVLAWSVTIVLPIIMIVSPTLRPAISRMLPSPSFVTTTPAPRALFLTVRARRPHDLTQETTLVSAPAVTEPSLPSLALVDMFFIAMAMAASSSGPGVRVPWMASSMLLTHAFWCSAREWRSGRLALPSMMVKPSVPVLTVAHGEVLSPPSPGSFSLKSRSLNSPLGLCG
mmetsp:Transcript_10383/g.24411  ORF Transcript_10383/g.24411 Transcript_10383/m.24411 type:complete len:231 (+) Transcript_10383:448-1140(+)